MARWFSSLLCVGRRAQFPHHIKPGTMIVWPKPTVSSQLFSYCHVLFSRSNNEKLFSFGLLLWNDIVTFVFNAQTFSMWIRTLLWQFALCHWWAVHSLLQPGLPLGLAFPFAGEFSFLFSYIKTPSSHALGYQYQKFRLQQVVFSKSRKNCYHSQLSSL